jgi:ABC-type cobalt transport system substrate-binding protein
MKRWIPLLMVAVLLAPGFPCASAGAASWTGVDETVIEKFADQAGRPASEPFINTDQGDLLLFVFLLAGTIGGFAAGYWFRVLFPPRREKAILPEREGDSQEGAHRA